MDTREANLLDRARRGDATAFARLVERHWAPLHRWLFLLTGQRQAAEDLTQETFLRAWRSLSDLRDVLRFRGWLYAIARHCLQDLHRRPRECFVGTCPDQLPTPDLEPLSSVVSQETCERIRSEFARLPELYRAALAMWTQQELSYAEVAEALGTTEETARWRVCKARQLLHERLRPYLDGKP